VNGAAQVFGRRANCKELDFLRIRCAVHLLTFWSIEPEPAIEGY